MSQLIFTDEHIAAWAALGPPVRQKPTNPKEVKQLKERKVARKELKKKLVQELNDDPVPEETKNDESSNTSPKWSARAIEFELDRIVEEQRQLSLQTTEDENKQDDEEHNQRKLLPYQLDNSHPDNTMDHRAQGGPLLQYLWCEPNRTRTGRPSMTPPLQGQTLYLGGEVGSDGNLYCIPGHADKVLMIDRSCEKVKLIGPVLRSNKGAGVDTSNGRLYKWLRGIVVGDIIYGLPCHADDILKIHVPTQTITTLKIPYEDLYSTETKDGETVCEAHAERTMIWKYHGGTICPLDGCIYAIPQRASQVLKLDPKTEKVSFHGPKFPGHCKWYGGILGKQDGAIYGIPHNASGVLRISPEKVTVHGDFGANKHWWHGGAAASNGVIVSVPANADTALCITPGEEPILTLVGDASIVQAGRHRDDKKYKYLGAMCGTNGKVYVFPCASEYVLQVDTEKMEAKNVGPNLRDSGMEMVFQNKWQNGLTCVQDQCVYGMPLSGHTLLRVDCSKKDEDPDVTVWTLPSPRRECKDKFEGGIMTDDGVMYTVPNNHKGVLRIQPARLSGDH
ncbi:unnamed protein product [Cylindrotheca closterium]|uniref:Uncharacterized protein n=1 Tax=Cylindrotheca closterium TaxID=2856 RepID=A0AAD2CUX0_9STRA|nr:unnamed protein product [Cylindrotheca closterium]